MTYKICPICDQKIKNSNYCPNCRRFIRKPLTINVDYYLNERHPSDWHDCTYHDFPQEQTPASNSSGTSRSGQAPTANTSRNKQSSSQGGRPTSGKTSGGHGGSRKKSSFIFVAVFILILISWLVPAISYLIDDISSQFSIISDEYRDAPSPEETDITEQILDEDEVKAAGKHCNSLGHFHADYEQFKKMADELMEELGYIPISEDTSSQNSLYPDGQTYYSTNLYCYYQKKAESGEDGGAGYDLDGSYIFIDFDTATGEVHSIFLSLPETEAIRLAMEKTAHLLTESGDWPMTENDTGDWLDDACQMLKTDGGSQALSNDRLDSADIIIYGGSYDSTYFVEFYKTANTSASSL